MLFEDPRDVCVSGLREHSRHPSRSMPFQYYLNECPPIFRQLCPASSFPPKFAFFGIHRYYDFRTEIQRLDRICTEACEVGELKMLVRGARGVCVHTSLDPILFGVARE